MMVKILMCWIHVGSVKLNVIIRTDLSITVTQLVSLSSPGCSIIFLLYLRWFAEEAFSSLMTEVNHRVVTSHSPDLLQFILRFLIVLMSDTLTPNQA